MAADEEIISGDGEKKEEKNASGGGGSVGYILTAVLILNIFLMGAVAYLQFTAHQREKDRQDVTDVVKAQMKQALAELEAEKEGAVSEIEQDGKVDTLQPFTANLAQGDGPQRFLRMTVVLKYSKDSKEEEYTARTPQIRDKIISIINSKRPEDLLKVEGKAYLKEEIKAAINAFLVEGRVLDVYYVGFQIN